MPLAFPSLTTDSSGPVATWPTEAVQAALERGDLPDWHRLAVQIGRQPWGQTSRQVEEVLRSSRPYGVADTMEAVIARARASAEQSEREQVAAEIRRLIDRSGLTRAQFAAYVGTSAPRLTTYAKGKVTPSAAFMVRIRRLVDAIEEYGNHGGR